jgi:general secretion pathway protein B
MSFILDALKRAEAERERGRAPGLNAPNLAPAPEAAADHRHLPSWVWALLGALLMLIAALAWSLTGKEDVPTQPATPATPEPAIVTPATLSSQSAPASHPESNWPYNAQTPKRSPGTAMANKVPTSPAPTTSGSAPSVYSIKALPPEIQQDLPSLQFGGAMYSEHPPSRMLIVNGQALREGDRVTPELLLREIKLRSAIMEFRGYAYTVNY